MAGIIVPQNKGKQGLLQGSITGVNPTQCLFDGSDTPVSVITGHPYFPSIGDRVALVKVGQQYLALATDLAQNASLGYIADDLWHAVGDPGEPAFQSGVDSYVGVNDMGTRFGNTLRFTRDRAGVVWMEGLVSIPTAVGSGNGMVIFQLPHGYRPAFQLCFSAVCGNAVYQVGVDPDGSVYIQYGPSTVTNYLSLDSVNFVAEDGLQTPNWVDLSAFVNTAGGWSVASTFVSTYASASGTPSPPRIIEDSVGDLHMSGFVGGGATQNTASSITGLGGLFDDDFPTHIFLLACNNTPGYCRGDIAGSAGTLGHSTYGANTANASWISLDGIAMPSGQNANQWAPGVYVNSWATYTGSSYPGISLRQNRIGTVYLRGLIHGTANSVADVMPAYQSGDPTSPNISKIFPMATARATGMAAVRTDIGAGGVSPGLAIFDTALTTTWTALYGIRYCTRRYGA